MADIYKGNKDLYKEKVLSEALFAMDNNQWNLTRLKNDCGKAINLDPQVIKILREYYKGKIIKIEEYIEYGINNKYRLSLKILWDNLDTGKVSDVEEVRLDNGNYLRHTWVNNEDYYDLIDKYGCVVCMDGELCEVLEETKDFLEIVNENIHIRFKLSRKEFEIAAMN